MMDFGCNLFHVSLPQSLWWCDFLYVCPRCKCVVVGQIFITGTAAVEAVTKSERPSEWQQSPGNKTAFCYSNIDK